MIFWLPSTLRQSFTLFAGPPAFSRSLIGLIRITTFTVSLSFEWAPAIEAMDARMFAAFFLADFWVGLVGTNKLEASGFVTTTLYAAFGTPPAFDKKLLSAIELRSWSVIGAAKRSSSSNCTPRLEARDWARTCGRAETGVFIVYT